MTDAIELFASRLTPPGEIFGGRVALPSLTGSADAFLALSLLRLSSPPSSPPPSTAAASRPSLVLAITPGIPDAERLADDLALLTAESPTRILEFPPALSDDRSALGLRLKTIAALRAWEINPVPTLVVASYPALLSPIPSNPDAAVILKTWGQAPKKFAEICGNLAKIGYHRVPQVEREGDYAVRGGIIDAWSPGEEFPVRAEFFGDELESLRTFDAATQLSVERVDNCEFLPIEAADKVEGDGKGAKLPDLLPAGSAILALEHNAYNLENLLPPSPPSLISTGYPAPTGAVTFDLQTVPLPGFAELGADEAHHPELFEAARKRLDQHVAAAKQRGARVLKLDALTGGFELPSYPSTSTSSSTSTPTSTSPALLVITKADRVFTKRKLRRLKTNSNAGARLDDFDELEPGEYVVHVDHGVGRYIGSSEIVTDGRRTEVFTIEYADGAKLHVPAAHAHLLSRYVGVKGEAVRLHRLDGRKWEKDKKNAQKAVADLAAALLETQAKREIVPGFAYDTACEGLEAFEAAFPYEETPDQTAAIAAVKQDLAATKPMDRLICGDAGYGKTEVAMRAAYIAALNGKQVAILAPTTVLAEQHFETFTSRFDGTPVRIESMSRFQSAATHEGTFKRLATGACDIVIGTHAILSSKTVFHDLGLIIIDEEQRFGVRHKEFLKRLRETADVLTLSATPIPRTLYLSMTGARDLSLLRSPPRERVAVDTKVVTDSDEIVRHAVNAELARGGQVFFLHNRVTTIGKAEKRLQAILPTARIVVAHGQMDARTLARKMRDFMDGKFDILLSTTIIESGIDIPRANTILVDHAETFGLADLYQLRGRVGRSSQEGRAVFLLPTGGLVDSDARERLKALQRHGGLGSGFNLAVRDLELRGAGNLLGSQQSGHIAAVGFGLYCQLLQRTIALLKGEKVKEVVDVRVNLDFLDPKLPYDYIEEDALRMNLLRRFAEVQDLAALRRLGAEMVDRFGPPPADAKLFLRVAELRVRAAAAGIGAIDVKGARAIFYRNGTREIARVTELTGKSPERKLAELLRSFTDRRAH